jgi:CRP-like cAMP-binding protein
MSVLKDKLHLDSYIKIFKEIKFECFTENRTIFEAGDIGRKMYFVLYGEVGILLPLPQKEA